MKAIRLVQAASIDAGKKVAGMLMMFVIASGAAAPAMAQPANDLCDNAVGITAPQIIAGTTTAATLDDTSAAGFCGTGVTSPGVWYNLTPATSGHLTTTTCGPNGSNNYDTKIHVFRGTCAAPVCVGGNDDSFDVGCTSLASKLTVPVTAGTTYRVLVSGFGGATGDFTLDVGAIKTLPESIACARAGINALMQPEITGPAQKAQLLQLLDTATRYEATPYRGLALFSVNAVANRVDGCKLRGTPDTISTHGGAGMDFVNSCASQAPISQCLTEAQTILAAPAAN